MAAGCERRQEEGQALDVVGVRVRQEQVEPERPLVREGQPKLARAGAAVEDEQRAVVGRDLDARRVTAVAQGLGAGRRDGAARAPEADADISAPLAPAR